MFGKNGPTLWELTRQALSSTRRGYDLLAPKFEATPFRTPDEILIPALSQVGTVDAALDLCCGTGAAVRVLLPRCRERLVGVDFSPGMLEQARILTTAPPGLRLEWVEANVFDLRHDAEFDLVTCFGALGHILPERRAEFLRVVHSALKPGGRFVLVSARHPPLLSPQHLVLRAFNGVMRLRNALLRPPFIMYYLTWLLPEIQTVLEETGFKVEVRSGVFERPFQRYELVIATRR
jgi:SAM-dependent methyltransferase